MATTVTLKPNAIDISGSTSGTTTLQATAVAGTTTLTLPAATDTLVGKATTDTLTNKTLTGAAMNGTVGATTPSTGAFTTVQIGTNPAGVSIGVLGIPNQKRIYGRNAANSADVNILYVDGSNSLVLGPSDAAVINSSGNLGVGTTSPLTRLDVSQANAKSSTGVWHTQIFDSTSQATGVGGGISFSGYKTAQSAAEVFAAIDAYKENSTAGNAAGALRFHTQVSAGSGLVEAARINSSGDLLVGQTTRSTATVGFSVITVGGDQGQTSMTTSGTEVLNINRNTSDGELVRFRQDNTVEGTISVSGTTVSYNGGHLSRWAQTTTAKDESLVKGTVLSNLDAMNIYTDAEGNPIANEQLNKVKVSDVEGDSNVAGVFVNWTYDEQHGADEINMAMTGDMIIRIAQGVTVARGDLLISAGDGTAKPQSDDIVRSKTVAKVTSTYVTCTYADGSYCVPCVLMAC